MTRDQQIHAVMKPLVVPPSEREECRACIENMLDILDDFGKSDEIFAAERSTKDRRILHNAARRFRAAYDAFRTKRAVPVTRRADGKWREYIEDVDYLIEWSKPRPKQKVYSLLTPPKQGIPSILAGGDALSCGAGKPTKATEFAHELLTRWGGGQKIVTTPPSHGTGSPRSFGMIRKKQIPIGTCSNTCGTKTRL